MSGSAGVKEWGDLVFLRMAVREMLAAKEARKSAASRAGRLAPEDPEDPAAVRRAAQQKMLTEPAVALEKAREGMLLDVYRANVPSVIQDWAAAIPGLASGALFPSIIALIGNPRVAVPYKWVPGSEVGSKAARVLVADGLPYPRSVRQLWTWAGCGDYLNAPKYVSTAGDQDALLAMGKRDTLRPRLHTFTSYLMRQKGSPGVGGSRYLKLLLEEQEKGRGKFHREQCQNKKRPPLKPNGCGTVANPEQGAPGSPWRPGHALMHAHRVVQKAFLEDLWEACSAI